MLGLVLSAILMVAPVTSADVRQEIVQAAMNELGKPYEFGAEGPDTFDCSGLVYYVFKETGHLDLIGGVRYTAQHYYDYAVAHNLLVSKPEPGDLVFWHHEGETRVAHMGIYKETTKRGKHMVISARVSTGVAVHRVEDIYVLVGYADPYKGLVV